MTRRELADRIEETCRNARELSLEDGIVLSEDYYSELPCAEWDADAERVYIKDDGLTEPTIGLSRRQMDALAVWWIVNR